MAKLSILAGSTSQTVDVFLQDSSKTDGSGLTGLVFNSSGLTCYYNFPRAASTQITLATLSTATSAWSSGGFKEIDATNQPGKYRFDIPDAVLAAASGRSVSVCFFGASHLPPTYLEIELTGVDNQDASKYGMTGLGTAQTGDSYARLGAPAGASVSADVAGVKAVLPSGTTAVGTSGGLPTCDTTNSVKIQTTFKKNTALAKFMFLMVDSSGAPKTGLGTGITCTRNIDNAGFGSCTNGEVEVASGWYSIDLSAADLNGNNIAFRFTGTGAADRNFLVSTLP